MRIPLPNSSNLKDLGGLYLDLKTKTKEKQFIRSDHFLSISHEEINYLANYGVKVIIDLREEYQVRKYPDLLNVKPFIYYNVSLIEYNPSSIDLAQGVSLLDSYYTIINENSNRIKKVFDVILKHPHDCILFHCFAGKDRTGLIAYLLYSIVQADFRDILADYAATSIYIAPYVQKMCRQSENFKKKIGFWNSDPDNLIQINNYLINKFGSIENYLYSIGLTNADLSNIRYRFIETLKKS
ncbi:MAG: tyrosine-protein phosphatase [Acholeplasmatales bacterium]|jgi:protein-tyrosine phosphatase|nr:tyrosine-protein phosphatase [Acholeplasmatales bacterium]